MGASPAAAQETAQPRDAVRAIDSIFQFATPDRPGCAVGVSRNGSVIADRVYGLADVENRVPLSQAAMFDIGSTHKQFVAAAVLLLAEEGRLALTDDIRKHVPELPDYGHTVTVDHLLTHTGGLRDWTGLLPFAPEGTDVLQLILRQRGLNFVPGEEWSYSNSGYVLLKEIVGRASGMPFAEFARQRLFEPLGMRSSAYVADILQSSGERALAYQQEGTGWRQHMRLGNERGGGTVATTAGDLLRWNDALTSGRLGPFVTAKLEEPARLKNGRELTYARGLMVNTIPGGRMVSHSGGAAGYSTWLGRFTDHGVSVAVMCNFEPVSATALGGRVADLFLPPVDPQAPRPGPVAAPGVDVAGRAGLYFSDAGEPLRLGVDDGRLTVANGPPLVPVSADRFQPQRPSPFFRSQDAFEMTFLSDDAFELRSMEGQTTRYRRAQPWTPAPADLRGVDGRYESAELGSVFQLTAGADGLTARLEHAPDRASEFRPVRPDTFMARMAIMRLVRDAAGTVTGLEYGNPLVRSIRFTRVGDLPAGAAAQTTTAAGSTGSTASIESIESTVSAVSAGSTEAPPALEGLVGAYELAPGRILNVTLEGGHLYGQPAGGDDRLPLTHVSGATFSAGDRPITLTFTLDADGRATAAVMRQEGRELTLRRVP